MSTSRSRLRLRRSGDARPAGLALAVLVALPATSLGLWGMVESPPASAASARGQLTYSCQTAGKGYEDQARPYPFVTALQVEVPTQVRPGETLRISGVFSVQFPESLRSLAEDYFTYAQAVSDVVTIPVTVGGRTTVLKASRFDSGKVSTKNQPLILSSPVTAEPFVVPADATGEVVIDLPANDTVASNVDKSRVAFHAEALLSGGFVATFVPEYVYKAACTAPAKAQRRVASIPIAAPAPAPPSPPVSSGSLTGGAAPAAPPSTDDSSTSEPVTVGATEPDPSAPAVPTSSSAANTADSAAVPGTTPSVVPLAASPDGVLVPGWLLVTGAAAVMLAALLLAGWSHHRVRLVRAQLEG